MRLCCANINYKFILKALDMIGIVCSVQPKILKLTIYAYTGNFKKISANTSDHQQQQVVKHSWKGQGRAP